MVKPSTVARDLRYMAANHASLARYPGACIVAHRTAARVLRAEADRIDRELREKRVDRKSV